VDGAIVVAGKNNNKNWNNKNWNNKKVAVVRPYRVWNKGLTTAPSSVALRSERLSESGVDARLLGLLRPSACSSTDRAPDFESGGCRFEPCQARQ
jgi:hypothetical protein